MRFLFALLIASCGYRSVYAEREKLGVALSTSNVPDAIATDEVLAGMREELAKYGALGTGSSYPRAEIEVLRADEASEGVAAADGPDRLVPQSRATRVGLVVRAWISRGPNQSIERDTGDLRSLETIGVAPDPKSAAFSYDDALRTAGRRAGKRLADRLLGLPAPTEE